VRISTVVVDGEGFRSLGLLKGADMCSGVLFTGFSIGSIFKFAAGNQRGVLLLQ
jgi:hypothetical protein